MNIIQKETETVVTFPTRIETGAAISFEQQLAVKTKELKTPVIFDLNQVEYISSSFIRICIRMYKELGKSNFKIINPSPFVKDIFKLTGLAQMLPG